MKKANNSKPKPKTWIKGRKLMICYFCEKTIDKDKSICDKCFNELYDEFLGGKNEH